MNKTLLKIFGAAFALCTLFPAFAEDATLGVAQREQTDCDALRNEIAELIKIENPDEETAARLAAAQQKSRRDCVKQSAGRRTSGRTGALPVAIASENVAAAVAATAAPDNVADKTDEPTVAVETATAAPDTEQIAKNIEAGLCADGTEPNKFGCCAGETFKDLGDLVFACCKNETDECFPPIAKVKEAKVLTKEDVKSRIEASSEE